jgi:hypothetical protein
VIAGPLSPVAVSIERQPAYSMAAAEEIVAIRSKDRTAARLPANTPAKPSWVVSADVSGTQSKPMTPVRLGVSSARASSRALRSLSAASSATT